ncbi:unnamed protein product [Mycena citricolor]|uniref:CxC2-like cysteine cluster KDZ transposase-associated domain-containing protein n=1 Tax=Mycena citricolor TaxID=2018698 RepID=A0AAD2GZR0_9AGAR|nr:unnamed protein product [Mycena citricolor]
MPYAKSSASEWLREGVFMFLHNPIAFNSHNRKAKRDELQQALVSASTCNPVTEDAHAGSAPATSLKAMALLSSAEVAASDALLKLYSLTGTREAYLTELSSPLPPSSPSYSSEDDEIMSVNALLRSITPTDMDESLIQPQVWTTPRRLLDIAASPTWSCSWEPEELAISPLTSTSAIPVTPSHERFETASRTQAECYSDMVGTSWTSEAQKELLTTQVPTFILARTNERLPPFWSSIWHMWFDKFPEWEAIGLGSDTDLSAEESTALKEAIEARKSQIKSWFPRAAKKFNGGRPTKSGSTMMTKALRRTVQGRGRAAGSRSRQAREVYATLHPERYQRERKLNAAKLGLGSNSMQNSDSSDSESDPNLDSEDHGSQSRTKSDGRALNCTIRNTTLNALWAAATLEERREVEEIMEKEKTTREEKLAKDTNVETPQTPEQYQISGDIVIPPEPLSGIAADDDTAGHPSAKSQKKKRKQKKKPTVPAAGVQHPSAPPPTAPDSNAELGSDLPATDTDFPGSHIFYGATPGADSDNSEGSLWGGFNADLSNGWDAGFTATPHLQQANTLANPFGRPLHPDTRWQGFEPSGVIMPSVPEEQRPLPVLHRVTVPHSQTHLATQAQGLVHLNPMSVTPDLVLADPRRTWAEYGYGFPDVTDFLREYGQAFPGGHANNNETLPAPNPTDMSANHNPRIETPNLAIPVPTSTSLLPPSASTTSGSITLEASDGSVQIISTAESIPSTKKRRSPAGRQTAKQRRELEAAETLKDDSRDGGGVIVTTVGRDKRQPKPRVNPDGHMYSLGWRSDRTEKTTGTAKRKSNPDAPAPNKKLINKQSSAFCSSLVPVVTRLQSLISALTRHSSATSMASKKRKLKGGGGKRGSTGIGGVESFSFSIAPEPRTQPIASGSGVRHSTLVWRTTDLDDGRVGQTTVEATQVQELVDNIPALSALPFNGVPIFDSVEEEEEWSGRETRSSEWCGSFFVKRTLKSLGVRIQLGHASAGNQVCLSPNKAQGDSFVIVDNNGVHEVGLDFCGCGAAGEHAEQLLRASLFPSTTTNPRSAATFNVLRRHHMLSFEAKCSVYEFYYSLARESDNMGLDGLKDRYEEFARIAKQWRHLQMMKRSARGHDPTGIGGTQDGECALLCPACPHPGKNLPDGWEKADGEKM